MFAQISYARGTDNSAQAMGTEEGFTPMGPKDGRAASTFRRSLQDLASSLAARVLVLLPVWIAWLPFPQPRCSHWEVRAKSWRVLRLMVPSYTDEMRHLRTSANLRLNHVSEMRFGKEDGCR